MVETYMYLLRHILHRVMMAWMQMVITLLAR